MIRLLITHVGIVGVVLFVARRTLKSRPYVPARVRHCHYMCLAYIIFMNIAGLSNIGRTLRWLFDGELLLQLEENYIALDGLPQVAAVVVWSSCFIGQCAMVFIATSVSRLNNNSRALLVRLFPLLVLAHAVGSYIDFRGAARLHFVQSESAEILIAVCLWCLVAWPYILIYRFYRGASSDILFLKKDPELADISRH